MQCPAGHPPCGNSGYTQPAGAAPSQHEQLAIDSTQPAAPTLQEQQVPQALVLLLVAVHLLRKSKRDMDGWQSGWRPPCCSIACNEPQLAHTHQKGPIQHRMQHPRHPIQHPARQPPRRSGPACTRKHPQARHPSSTRQHPPAPGRRRQWCPEPCLLVKNGQKESGLLAVRRAG